MSLHGLLCLKWKTEGLMIAFLPLMQRNLHSYLGFERIAACVGQVFQIHLPYGESLLMMGRLVLLSLISLMLMLSGFAWPCSSWINSILVTVVPDTMTGNAWASCWVKYYMCPTTLGLYENVPLTHPKKWVHYLEVTAFVLVRRLHSIPSRHNLILWVWFLTPIYSRTCSRTICCRYIFSILAWSWVCQLSYPTL